MAVELPNIPPGCQMPRDARAGVVTLYEIARPVDAFLKTLGDYWGQHFHLRERDLFEGQLWQALDGNATFALQDAADELQEEMVDV